MAINTVPGSSGLTSWMDWGIREFAFLGEKEARLECERMLESLLGISRSEIYLGTPPSSGSPAFGQFSRWIESRKQRIPLSYIMGKSSFWEHEFEVMDGVFIPRPETETLIESFLNESGFSENSSFRFLDAGTGTGIIALTLAKLFPESRGVGVDLSPQAVETARRNCCRLQVLSRVEIREADALGDLSRGVFDVIFSNPPYIPSGELETLEPEVQKEPRLALDGGIDGLDFYRAFMKQLSSLKKGGSLWLEVGFGQAEAVRNLLTGFERTEIFKDLNGIQRVVAGMNHG